ncbi:MAG: hypothetical protein VKL59_19050 [Nostocaceae cyanobacterium]|nr:hypothetical protein [Nostocaceae cyanobacterium]
MTYIAFVSLLRYKVIGVNRRSSSSIGGKFFLAIQNRIWEAL